MPKPNPLLPLDSIFRHQILKALDMARYTENPDSFSLPEELHFLLYSEVGSKAKSFFKKKYSHSYPTNIPSRDLQDSIQDFLSHKLVECFKNFNLLSAITSYIASSAADFHRNRIIDDSHQKPMKEEADEEPKAAIYSNENGVGEQVEYLKGYLHDYPGNQSIIEAILTLFVRGLLPAKPRQIFAHPDVPKWIGEICCKKQCPNSEKCEKRCMVSHTDLLHEWREWKKHCCESESRLAKIF